MLRVGEDHDLCLGDAQFHSGRSAFGVEPIEHALELLSRAGQENGIVGKEKYPYRDVTDVDPLQAEAAPIAPVHVHEEQER